MLLITRSAAAEGDTDTTAQTDAAKEAVPQSGADDAPTPSSDATPSANTSPEAVTDAENHAAEISSGHAGETQPAMETASIKAPAREETSPSKGPATEDAASKKPVSEPPEKDFLGALKQEPGLKVKAQLAGLWMLRDEPMKPNNEFRVSRARVKVSWTQWALIEAVVKAEVKEVFRGGGADSLLRDLYVRVQPISWLGFRVGQFKKPFGAIALASWSKFRLIKRGLVDDYVVEHLMYGDRDIGAMIEGRIIEKAKLDYAVGVFNGMGRNTREISFHGSKDFAARIEGRPLQWFEIGASGSLKLIEKSDLPGFVNQNNFEKVIEDEYPLGYSSADFIAEHGWMTGTAWMAGADVTFRPKKLRIIAEGMIGQNWWFEKYPYTWSAVLVASYRIKLGKSVPLSLEPALMGEVLTLMTGGMDNWRSRLWQVTPGVNLHIGKHVRLMIDGQLRFAEGSEADIDGSRREGLWPNEFPGAWADRTRLLVQLAFSI
jgi:hypothetical protein